MANPNSTSSSSFGALAAEAFRATPAYIVFSAVATILKDRRSDVGRRAVVPAR